MALNSLRFLITLALLLGKSYVNKTSKVFHALSTMTNLCKIVLSYFSHRSSYIPAFTLAIENNNPTLYLLTLPISVLPIDTDGVIDISSRD